MPQDSIMDMVNNIESLYADKIGMFDRWVHGLETWNQRDALKEAEALAGHFAEALETSEYIDGKYSSFEIREAARDMVREFESDYRDQAIKSITKEATRKPRPEDFEMDPGDVEHAKKYEALAQKLGIEKLKALIPVPPERVRRALERGDKHLNTIPLRKWDTAAFELNLREKGLSMSEGVCVLKHVAKWHYA